MYNKYLQGGSSFIYENVNDHLRQTSHQSFSFRVFEMLMQMVPTFNNFFDFIQPANKQKLFQFIYLKLQ